MLFGEVDPADRKRGWQLSETREVRRWDEILQVMRDWELANKRDWELAKKGWTRSQLRIEEYERCENGQFFPVNRI